MFGRFSHVRRRRLRRLRTVLVPSISAALLVGLLPATSLALPPDPTVAEKGRETLDLVALGQEETVTGDVDKKDLETLKVEVPQDLEQAPTGTVSAPVPDSGSVSFGSTASATQASATAQQIDLTPVEDLPVSLDPAMGLTARDPSNAGVSPLSHVAGKKMTPWISTTKNPAIVFGKYNQGHGVVAIDLRRIPHRYVDISSGPFPSSPRHSSYARKDSEVLVWNSIPAGAIVGHWPGG